MIRRRHLLFGAASLATTSAAHAGQTITVLIGGDIRSLADQQARNFLPFMMRHIPMTTIELKDVPDTNGLVAIRQLAQAPADGAVLGWVSTPELPARVVEEDGGDLMQHITLLGAVEQEPIAIVAASATRFGSAQDIMGQAAQNPNAVPLGTPPPGSPAHLAALRLRALVGTDLRIVTYPSAAQACLAAATGKVAASFLGLSDAVMELRRGRLRGLGVAAANSVDAFPDMPPLLASGIDLSISIRRGLAAPNGLPQDVVARLTTAMETATSDPDFHGQAETGGFRADWADGSIWSDEANGERAELAKLWRARPWRKPGAS